MKMIAFALIVNLLLPLLGTVSHAESPDTSVSGTTTRKNQPVDVETFLAPWKDSIAKSSRPAAQITLSPVKDDPRISKVGGLPYLPVGAELPIDLETKKPLQFLAQINFSEVPPLPDYPREGILQFFIANDDLLGLNLEPGASEKHNTAQRKFRIVYFPAVETASDKLKVPNLPPVDDSFPIDPKITLRMIFRATHERVSPEDGVEFPKVFGKDRYAFEEELAKKYSVDENDLDEALSEYLNPDSDGHKIGGYPSFTQSDPRPPESTRRLLFQLGTDDGNEGWQVMWGDSGIGAFFIDPSDLVKRDFSKVLYNWDCY